MRLRAPTQLYGLLSFSPSLLSPLLLLWCTLTRRLLKISVCYRTDGQHARAMRSGPSPEHTTCPPSSTSRNTHTSTTVERSPARRAVDATPRMRTHRTCDSCAVLRKRAYARASTSRPRLNAHPPSCAMGPLHRTYLSSERTPPRRTLSGRTRARSQSPPRRRR